MLSFIFFQLFAWLLPWQFLFPIIFFICFVIKIFIKGINISPVLQFIMLPETFSIFFNCFLHHIQGSIVFDRGWEFVGLSLDYFSDDMSEDLSTSGFGQFLYNQSMLKSSNRPNFLPDNSDQFLLQSLSGIVDFGDNKSNRDFPFQLLNFSNNSCLIDSRVSQQGLLHRSSRQPMPSSIDDIIQPGCNVEIPIIIKIPSISSGIESWGFIHVFIKKTLIVVVERGHERRRHG